MATFPVLSTMANGLSVFRTWMDAIGDNLANLNTVRSTDEDAFQARYVVAEAVDYGTAATPGIGTGSRVAGVEFGSAEGRVVYDPEHPLADAEGMVRMPDIDMGTQMTQLIQAQRGYQANLAVVDRARDAYLAALQIGR
jgi:flagellar basal-body rod protein FlgC